MQRHGQAVRFLPPLGPRVGGALRLGLLLFPRYSPGTSPRLEPLAPVEALRGLVEAEAVIRNLTQTRLEALVRWVESAPAYRLIYPDLASGLEWTRRALAEIGSWQIEA
ncbi:hypothetical protein [Thiocapsa marina]|uniref:hypothetical protein n=1 Tax=Thiocapsa marina TaxID=244573 RepID=UPI001F357154|nr:hypothetical protein [Thiocapsa marina]